MQVDQASGLELHHLGVRDPAAVPERRRRDSPQRWARSRCRVMVKRRHSSGACHCHMHVAGVVVAVRHTAARPSRRSSSRWRRLHHSGRPWTQTGLSRRARHGPLSRMPVHRPERGRGEGGERARVLRHRGRDALAAREAGEEQLPGVALVLGAARRAHRWRAGSRTAPRCSRRSPAPRSTPSRSRRWPSRPRWWRRGAGPGGRSHGCGWRPSRHRDGPASSGLSGSSTPTWPAGSWSYCCRASIRLSRDTAHAGGSLGQQPPTCGLGEPRPVLVEVPSPPVDRVIGRQHETVANTSPGSLGSNWRPGRALSVGANARQLSRQKPTVEPETDSSSDAERRPVETF